LWLPHKPETVGDIANDMATNGFRLDRAIATYEGKILDGRHRYEAALQAGVDPVFAEFQGTKEEAIAYVTSENVARRHLNNKEKEFFYVQRAEALGVNHRGGDRQSEEAKSNVVNTTMVPSQQDHADSLGVHRDTVARWERDRTEIKSDPELAKKAKTPEGYKEAKEVVKDRRQKQKEAIINTVPPEVIDLNAIARSKKETDIRSVGPAFVGLMETLCTKFDEKDIKRELVAFMHPDPLGLKVEALHKMADILSDLREDFSNETVKQQLN
jgi:DNA-binding XRE family transcriptional regulator